MLDEEWTYLLVGMVRVHGRLVLKVALACLSAAKPAKLALAVISCAHIEQRGSCFRRGME